MSRTQPPTSNASNPASARPWTTDNAAASTRSIDMPCADSPIRMGSIGCAISPLARPSEDVITALDSRERKSKWYQIALSRREIDVAPSAAGARAFARNVQPLTAFPQTLAADPEFVREFRFGQRVLVVEHEFDEVSLEARRNVTRLDLGRNN